MAVMAGVRTLGLQGVRSRCAATAAQSGKDGARRRRKGRSKARWPRREAWRGSGGPAQTFLFRQGTLRAAGRARTARASHAGFWAGLTASCLLGGSRQRARSRGGGGALSCVCISEGEQDRAGQTVSMWAKVVEQHRRPDLPSCGCVLFWVELAAGVEFFNEFDYACRYSGTGLAACCANRLHGFACRPWRRCRDGLFPACVKRPAGLHLFFSLPACRRAPRRLCRACHPCMQGCQCTARLHRPPAPPAGWLPRGDPDVSRHVPSAGPEGKTWTDVAAEANRRATPPRPVAHHVCSTTKNSLPGTQAGLMIRPRKGHKALCGRPHNSALPSQLASRRPPAKHIDTASQPGRQSPSPPAYHSGARPPASWN